MYINKLSLCVSNNLRWLNEQVTRLVSRLCDFQLWLQCWH